MVTRAVQRSDRLGAVWGPSGSRLEAVWSRVGTVWGPCGNRLETNRLGTVWGPSGSRLGIVWGPSGDRQGPSGNHLGRFGTVWELSADRLEAVRGPSGGFLGPSQTVPRRTHGATNSGESLELYFARNIFLRFECSGTCRARMLLDAFGCSWTPRCTQRER
jgi:hypothetical protein